MPLTDDEWRRFVPHFLRTFGDLQLPTSDEEADPYNLSSCDILWWVETLDAVVSETPEKASLVVNNLFGMMHEQVRMGHLLDKFEPS